MVVFRVTNRHQVVKRKSHLVERGPQARSLVHSRWQHHHRTLVEYHLVVQPQPPNHLQNYVLRRRPARHNRTPHIEFHPRGAQRGQKLLSRRLGEQFLFTARRIVKQRPILRHDAVKKLRPREHPLQILQPPSCHHQQPSPGCLQVLQRPHCHNIRHTIRGQRPVIVRGQPQVPHQPPSPFPATAAYTRIQSAALPHSLYSDTFPMFSTDRRHMCDRTGQTQGLRFFRSPTLSGSTKRLASGTGAHLQPELESLPPTTAAPSMKSD